MKSNKLNCDTNKRKRVPDGYTDSEIIEQLKLLRERGHGEMNIMVKEGEVIQFTVVKSYKRTSDKYNSNS